MSKTIMADLPPSEIPQSLCPECCEPQDDYDGFGVVMCDRCDYCKHVSETWHSPGLWRCDACGRTEKLSRP